MKKFLLFIFTSLYFLAGASAQFSRYVVQLKDKGATSFTLANPVPYLSTRAIARRSHYAIAIDSTDLPVPASYIAQIGQIPNVTILNVSRWLNAIAIQTTDANALAAINALPFVQGSTGVAAKNLQPRQPYFIEDIEEQLPAGARQQGTEDDHLNYGTASFNEIHLHQGEFLHNIGLLGQGMEISLLDGGFFNYTGLDAFDSVNANGQVKTTWDFVTGNTSVTEDNAHGMMCFSTLAANIPGQFMGKAPKASFNLFRTEDVSSEFPIEEFNWACGAERADSTGSDIISSSLGYGYQFNAPVADYPYSDLNGDITLSARAADLAAKKGLLVFIAAGNSGTDYWHHIITPADADSVLAVGAVSSSGVVGAFSSYGPSADGRIKPDVASIGVSALIQTSGNTIGTSNGTSYACPNMAGLGTCLWQGFPEFNNMRIVQALREAGNTFSTPNDQTGYGIPDMKKAFTSLLIEYAHSSVSLNACTATLNWNSKDVPAMRYAIERKAPGDTGYVKIADVNPTAGDALSNHSYEMTNSLTTLPTGTVSYRILQVVDSSAAGFTAVYIDTANVTLASSCTPTAINDPADVTSKISIVPNPSHHPVLIIDTRYAIPRMPIAVYDMRGQLILQMQESKPAGRSIITLPVAKLAGGRYVVEVFNGTRELGSAEWIKL